MKIYDFDNHKPLHNFNDEKVEMFASRTSGDFKKYPQLGIHSYIDSRLMSAIHSTLYGYCSTIKYFNFERSFSSELEQILKSYIIGFLIDTTYEPSEELKSVMRQHLWRNVAFIGSKDQYHGFDTLDEAKEYGRFIHKKYPWLIPRYAGTVYNLMNGGFKKFRWNFYRNESLSSCNLGLLAKNQCDNL